MSITVAPRKIEDIAHDFFFGAGRGGGGINIMGGGELQIVQMANWKFYVT